MNYKERTTQLQQLLKAIDGRGSGSVEDAEVVDGLREQVRELCRPSIPDSPSQIRPDAYRALLNLQHVSILTSQYSAFVEEISTRLSNLDHPVHDLHRKDLKEDKLLREIERDVERTFGILSWFGAPPTTMVGEQTDGEDAFWSRITLLENADDASSAELAKLSQEGSASTSPREPPPALSLLPPVESGETEGTVNVPVTPTSPIASILPDPVSFADPASPRPRTRRQALLRPLYVYATLNPGLSYVQGMNSIMAVFWWIFARGGDTLEAEASAFFAMGEMVSQLQDLYVHSLDGTISPGSRSPRLAAVGQSNRSNLTPIGLGATLTRYTSLLTWLDPNVAASLENRRIDPSMYVFRWLTTIFANEFALPDLVRVWDRVIVLFPSASQPVEALSPILGHLLDLSLAMVLMGRQTIVSPFSDFHKITTMLQNPQIDGEAVDKLLNSAWDIRERRLGKSNKRSSVTVNNWRATASKWTAAANAASTGPTAASLRQRFWSVAATASPRQEAQEYDVDDTASNADSEASAATAPPLFASRGQRIGFGSEEPMMGTRYRASTLSDIARVDGKVLPPPPEQIDARERTLAHLPPPPSVDEDEEEYEDEDEEEGPSLQERAANTWGGLKSSLTRFAASDTAASLSKTTTNFTIAAHRSAASISHSTSQLGSSDAAASLSKATTNLSIQAQLLREQLAEQGPERLAKIKGNVAAATGRFTASTGSEGAGPARPGSPVAEPFTPPRFGYDSPTLGRRPPSPSPGALSTPDNLSTSTNGSGSNGPKPLLLSSSARRAANGSQDSTSPPSSKRNSFVMRSPSTSPSLSRSPVLYSDAPVAPLGIPRSPSISGGHARSASSFTPPSSSRLPASSFHSRSASTVPEGSLGLVVDPDVPIQSLRLASPDEEQTAPKIRRPTPRARGSEGSTTAVPSADGRGWSLSDAPVGVATPREDITSSELAFDPSRIHESQLAYNSPTSPQDDSAYAHDSFHSTASSMPLSPVEESLNRSLPGRHSSLSSSIDSPTLTDQSNANAFPGAPQRSKGIRRAAATAKKRTGRSQTGSISSLSDLTGVVPASDSPGHHPPRESSFANLSHQQRRSLSSFLVGGDRGSPASASGSGEDDADASSVASGSLRRSTGRRTTRRTMSQASESFDGHGNGEGGEEWEEATDILNAYGGE